MKKSNFFAVFAVFISAVVLSVSTINTKIEQTKNKPFDYPYIVYSKDKDNLFPYSKWFPDYISFDWDTNQFISPDENMISYQQAANLAGEALKNIYGLSEHTNENGVIQLYNHVVYNSRPTDSQLAVTKYNTGYNQPHRYVYRFLDSNDTHYYASIDRYNGTVFNIGIQSVSFVAGEEATATDQEMQAVESIIKESIQHLGITAEITSMDIKHCVNISGLNYYNADVFLSDGCVAVVSIYKPYGEDYQLKNFNLNSPLNIN